MIPASAASLPQPIYLDAQGRVLPDSAPVSQIAFTDYDIHIQPGIRYQPHPAFARDAQGAYRYHVLTPNEIEHVTTLDDFKETGTRELVAEDYVYQIKRLASPKLNSPIFGMMSEYIVGLKEYGEQLQGLLLPSLLAHVELDLAAQRRHDTREIADPHDGVGFTHNGGSPDGGTRQSLQAGDREPC